ncbi:MAG: YabP/YqfC family sporulation protein [Bacillota bacterium]
MNRSGRFGQRLAGLLDLPRHLVMNVPYIAITGGAQVVVENHRGLRHCYPDRIVVGATGGQVTIRGEDLVVAVVTKDELMVCGRIREVTLE